jgi:hypothetical protein
MLKQELHHEKVKNKETDKKLRESEFKRQDNLKKIMESQKKIVELEHEVAHMKQRFKDLMMKKASGILREQFEELEKKYKEA